MSRQFILPALLFFASLPAFADAVTDLIDCKSSEWRGAAAVTSKLEKHTGKEPMKITVHYTDIGKNYTRPLKEKLRVLYNYSVKTIEGTKKKLWGDIPYHYYIDANGKLGEARNPIYQPDSNTAYSRDGHIAVVLEGNSKDGITKAQKEKLFALLKALQEKYRVATARVSYHKHYAETDCPGVEITKAVEEYKESKKNDK